MNYFAVPSRIETHSLEMTRHAVREFVIESNRIENIEGASEQDIEAHLFLLGLERVTVEDLIVFVTAIGGGPLRERTDMNIHVGEHHPPPGGPEIRNYLQDVLRHINHGEINPYQAHIEYETLHPFMDGNGRSGRVLWAWQMQRDGKDPYVFDFLRYWYYQSLQATRLLESEVGDLAPGELDLRDDA